MTKQNILNNFLPALLIIAAGFFFAFASNVSAATYRNRTAQSPGGNPTYTQSVRVYMESDTAFGETAGVEYLINGVYTRVLGTYDTSGPAPSNWYADIPVQTGGTYVQYQLFTRNQGGTDYGFTGFNWNYTVQVTTAAAVSVTGRVTTAAGKSIANAYVSLTDESGNTRTVLTNSFGFYGIVNVSSGGNCVISVKAKSYQFADPAQFLFLGNNLTDVNFTALQK